MDAMEKRTEALNREVEAATRPMAMVCREFAAVCSLLEGIGVFRKNCRKRLGE
jgi:hypothetical protein